jgi:predicted dehydrogenase
MPSRVTAFAGFGKRHNIEVEDEVSAFLEYPNGATGMFVTSTGEAPGTNRLEIAGDRGKLVYEGDMIVLIKNEMPASEFCRLSPESFAAPKTSRSEIKPEDHGGQHKEIIQNFVKAIESGEPVIAPAAEGIFSVELANAMLYSAWTGQSVDLPLDGNAYEKALGEKIANSRTKEDVRDTGPADMAKSFT